MSFEKSDHYESMLYDPSESDHSMDDTKVNIEYQEKNDDEEWIRFIQSPSFMRVCVPMLGEDANFNVNVSLYQREWREETCELKPGRERERGTPPPYRLRYRNHAPCCVECGMSGVDGWWNNNTETEEEDLFWCSRCKEEERMRNYKEAEPMRAFCENPECALQVKEERKRIGNTKSIRIERKHLLLHDNISELDVCIYTKGKLDNITGSFFCRQCWKNYVECTDLIPYRYHNVL